MQLSRPVEEGGSDQLFGRLKAKKVGSLPPVLVVFRPLLLGFYLLNRALFQRSARPQGEELGTGRCAA